MYPTVEDILQLKELKDCKTLTGNSGLMNQVKAITVMDNPDISSWMKGGEILLSNGYLEKEYDEETFLYFIDRLMEKNTAALFLKLKRYLEELPQSVIDYAAQVGFPIVVIPNVFSWLDITTPVNKYIIEKQYYFVEKSLEIRDHILRLVLEGRNMDTLCAKGSELLGKPLAVFDKDWRFISGSNDVDWESFQPYLKQPYLKQKSKLESNKLDFFEHYLLTCKLGKLIFVPITYDYFTWGYIGLAIGGKQSISVEDTFKLEQLAMLFMLELIKEKELKLVTRRYTSDFLFELLDGVLTNKIDILERANRLEKKIFEQYELLVFDSFSKETINSLYEELSLVFDKEGGFFKNILICGRDDHIILFLPYIVEKGRTLLKETIDLIENNLNANMFFGVSTIHEITSLNMAYKEALFSLSVRNLTNQKLVHYEKLGFLRFFWEDQKRLSIPFVTSYYMESFKPIVDHDEENETDLVETLKVLLQNEMSISKTAESLFIHENTLRARIKRIETITNRNLKRPYDLFSLILGLEIHYFMKG